ncbi:MAG: glycoside hydrolase family 3 C-terminal domain-containing protein [Bacteroidetes bacterium]|nr:glycoside hydrolase family 3 C-terminal domain-containing protein [Bacteroidota bacterium]
MKTCLRNSGMGICMFILFLYAGNAYSQVIPGPVKYTDPKLPITERVNDLVSRLSLQEKVMQMQNNAPAISRLGIPAYNWWSECLHGVARNGIATVFPQAIGMAATWDPELIFSEADVISTEARAKYNECVSQGKRGIYQGLTFWSPNINIFRDPRWGRGQETYGEDPFLTGRMGIAFVKGLQGNDARYFKVIATAKHFAVHSGPEPDRHSFDAWCSERDLYETYLPAFEALVRYGKVYSVMGAYNRFWSEPCTASDLLLDKILRKKWGFTGYVTSDCGAIWDIYNGHKLQPDSVRASVLGVKAGCDLTCGDEYGSLVHAVSKGYISLSEIDISVKRLFTARFRLGLFDPDSLVPYAGIKPSENNTAGHDLLSLKIAEESMVLLKNDNHTLPFGKKIKQLAVIGPYADRLSVLLGNYCGKPSNPVTILNGIREVAGNNIDVLYAKGVDGLEDAAAKPLEKQAMNAPEPTAAEMESFALQIASKADAIVFVGGISPYLEGEEMDVNIPGFSGGDRTSLDLPANQTLLLKKLAFIGKPLVLILTNGSALSVKREADQIQAILEAWYPGQQGGKAVAEVLFGKYNPAGRLPITFYKSADELPPFTDYSMKGRTYRYFSGEPWYPFGFGLSYSKFAYLEAGVDKGIYSSADTVKLKVKVKNEGPFDGDEVIQVYYRKKDSGFERPLKSLCGFQRKNIRKGLTESLVLPIAVSDLRIFDPGIQDYYIEPGKYELLIGPDSSTPALITTIDLK